MCDNNKVVVFAEQYEKRKTGEAVEGITENALWRGGRTGVAAVS